LDSIVETRGLEHILISSRDWILDHVLTWQVVGQLALLAVITAIAFLLARRLESGILRWTDRRALRAPIRRGVRTVAHLAFPLSLLLLTGLARTVLLQVTGPSNSYLLALAASLLAAWVVISLSSHLFRNPLLARTVALAAWTIAALNIVGLLDPVIAALDSVAVTFGALRISILTVVKGALLLVVLVWLAVVVGRVLESRIQHSHSLTPSLQLLLVKLLKIGLLSLAVVIALNSVGIDLTALAVLSGAVGLGIGFGLQKVVSNLVSGWILLLDKSIKPGDVIEVENTFGWITTLGARYISVSTRDGKEYLIPNEDLITQRVINWTHSADLVRLEVTFGVAYESDPHQVRRLAVAAATKPARVVDEPQPVCHLQAFGDSSLDFLLRFWIKDPTAGVANVTGEVLLGVWDSFKEAGIQIPFPHREVIFRTPVTVDGIPEQAPRDRPAAA
jgi:small-conductance mechanosensitive channel